MSTTIEQSSGVLVDTFKRSRELTHEVLFGSTRHSVLIFKEYAEHIMQEEGIDVYEKKAQKEAYWSVILHQLEKLRKDRTPSIGGMWGIHQLIFINI